MVVGAGARSGDRPEREQIHDQQLATAARHAAEIISDPGLEVKHKLKVTIPLLPVLVYEGKFELNSRMSLSEVWRRLYERFTRGYTR